MTWWVAPSVETGPRSHALAAVALRLMAGFLWLYNVSWKHAPDFGQDNGSALYRYTGLAVSDPVFAPYSWVVEHVILPHFLPFAWLVLATETALAVLLLSGAFVRIAAAFGVAQSVAIGLSVALAPHEWPWAYAMLVGIHLLLLFSAAGRYLSVDAVRAGKDDGRRLAYTFGALAVIAGLVAEVRSLGDPLDPSGPALELHDLQVGIGDYNLLGGVVLMLLGVLLLVWARTSSRRAVLAAAGVGTLAGLSLEAQLGFSDPVLGGSPTSAALYFTLAVIAAALALAPTGVRRLAAAARR